MAKVTLETIKSIFHRREESMRGIVPGGIGTESSNGQPKLDYELSSRPLKEIVITGEDGVARRVIVEDKVAK